MKAHIAQHPYSSTDETASVRHQRVPHAKNDKPLWHVQKQIDTLITACDTGVADWEAADAAATKDIDTKVAEIARVRMCSHPSCFMPYAEALPKQQWWLHWLENYHTQWVFDSLPACSWPQAQLSLCALPAWDYVHSA